MIVMRPIREDAVLAELNANRFAGEICGYVIMDGPEYLGSMLYQIENKTTIVLDCSVKDTAVIDGAVRACIGAGENAGADCFCVNETDEKLKKWRSIFCKNEVNPIPNEKIFHKCK
ncbi:MAG: hypothetical protein RR867_01300 [Ruthenibacterium sp.]